MTLDLQMRPNVSDSEAIVLGSILKNNQKLYLVNDLLELADFFFVQNGNLYEFLVKEITDSRLVDFMTIHQLSQQKKDLLPDIIAISDMEVSRASSVDETILHHAKLIKEKSNLRKLLEFGLSLYEKAHDQDASPEDLFESAQFTLSEIKTGAKDNVRSAFQIGKEQDDLYEQQQNDTYHRIGIPTGLIDVDLLTGGLKKQDLVILGGRPGTGKTAFICNLLESARDNKILFFSLEQGRGEIWNRMISKKTQINGFTLDIGAVSKDRWTDVFRASNNLKNLHFWIDDSGGARLNRIIALSKRMKSSKEGLDLVIVDYIQLVRHLPPKNVRYERREVVAEISHSFKQLAKDLNVAVLCIAHINREVSDCEEPELRHIRECGDIEQDADMVMFLWKKLIRPTEQGKKGEEHHMITVAKHRNGPTGKKRVIFKPEYTAFYDLAPWSEQ